MDVGLLIYNAGASTCNEPFLEADLAQFQKVTDLNVTRMLELVQHYGRAMVNRGRGGRASITWPTVQCSSPVVIAHAQR